MVSVSFHFPVNISWERKKTCESEIKVIGECFYSVFIKSFNLFIVSK